jgi:hypothetical protein
MCDWVAGAAELLEPLYEALKKDVLKENYLQADETTLKVQDPEVKDRLHTGYLWSALAPPNKVFFHYAESRAGEVPKELFKDRKAFIQTDAYAGYNTVYLPNGCTRIACLAHIRRKFIETRSVAKTKADSILSLIAELYKLERKLEDRSPEERMERRKKKAFPLLKRLYRLLRLQKRNTLPQTPYAKALNYALENSRPMLQYLRDGSYRIDNNLIENQMRPIALGRKNYLFAGSHEGARRAAIIYSLLNTCRLNNVNSFDYLRDVIKRIHSHPASQIAELLPYNWTPRNMG